MERIQMSVLEKWKDSKDRKPLTVKGLGRLVRDGL